ncbi:MAG: hypothetical protein NTV86_04015 [Planctomycetota bacterium]|nr:hypothetical protein [Planctomycetota bacterium]
MQSQTTRRGAVYALVLIVAMLLTVIALAGLSISRVNAHSAGDSGDWLEARVLAFSGAEHAMAQINADANWRTTYATATCQKSLGHGSFSWRLVDQTDGSLTDDASEPFVILSTGTVRNATFTLRVAMAPAGGGVTYGIATPTTVTVGGGSRVDSFDSTLGAYGGSNVGSQATVATNSTASGAVAVSGGSTVQGSALVGVGGNPSTVVSVSGGGSMTGTKTAMTQAMTLPTVTSPTGMGSSTGNVSYGNGGTFLLSSNMHVTNFTVAGGVKLQVSGNVTILADGPVTVGNGATVEILPGASLKFYFNNTLTLNGGMANKVNGANLSRMQFLNLGTGAVSLGGGGALTGVILSPNGTVTMNGGFQLYGAMVAKSLSVTNGAAFHEDKRITGGADPVTTGSGSAKPRATGWSQVVN